MIRLSCDAARKAYVLYLLDAERRKVVSKNRGSPQKWYIDLVMFARVNNKAIICVSMTMEKTGFSRDR